LDGAVTKLQFDKIIKNKKNTTMKKIIFCVAVNFLCLGYFVQVQAQCRVIAPDAKEWIENNREKIAKMTRAEWQELEEGYKWIIFATALSAEQRHNFFKLKIEQVRDSFEWSKEEREHIDKIYQLFIDNPDMYSEERDEKKSAEIAEFTEKWAMQAIEKLNWTPKLIQGIAMDCGDLLDKEGNVRVTSKIEFEKLKLNE
jgi:hypothetical protein